MCGTKHADRCLQSVLRMGVLCRRFRYGLGFEHRDGAVVITRVKPDSPAEVLHTAHYIDTMHACTAHRMASLLTIVFVFEVYRIHVRLFCIRLSRCGTPPSLLPPIAPHG